MTNVYLDGEACPESALSPVANSQQGITTLLHDSDPSTCLSPYSQTMTSFRVLVPAKGSGIVRMVGQRISCSPVSGITILAVTGCVEGTCRHHHCYASLDYIGDGYVMCRYRCVNDTPKLEYALVDLSRITANPAGSICEVYAWHYLTIRSLKSHVTNKLWGVINWSHREGCSNFTFPINREYMLHITFIPSVEYTGICLEGVQSTVTVAATKLLV